MNELGRSNYFMQMSAEHLPGIAKHIAKHIARLSQVGQSGPLGLAQLAACWFPTKITE
ncbi:MAG: hypothetical protein ACNYPI_08345 [Arenicellales bacterium WSBS_2016_MAG_OTU3]